MVRNFFVASVSLLSAQALALSGQIMYVQNNAYVAQDTFNSQKEYGEDWDKCVRWKNDPIAIQLGQVRKCEVKFNPTQPNPPQPMPPQPIPVPPMPPQPIPVPPFPIPVPVPQPGQQFGTICGNTSYFVKNNAGVDFPSHLNAQPGEPVEILRNSAAKYWYSPEFNAYTIYVKVQFTGYVNGWVPRQAICN